MANSRHLRSQPKPSEPCFMQPPENCDWTDSHFLAARSRSL